jgi:hypothetical protein
LQEVQAEIRRSLNDRVDGFIEGSDLELEEEEELYMNASRAIEERAKKERTRRMESAVTRNEKLDLENLLVMFDSTNIAIAATIEPCESEACCMCRVLEVQSDFKENLRCMAPSFKFFDKEEEEVLVIDSDNSKNGRKRPSRTAQISIQKTASARLLKEMLHTLAFIDHYNKGFQEESKERSHGEEEDDHDYDDDDAFGSEKEVTGSGKRKSSIIMRHAPKRRRIMISSSEELPTSAFSAMFESLSHTRHVEEYVDGMRQNRHFQRISFKDDIGCSIQEMRAVLHRNSAELNHFAASESILAEEKALNRGIRGYSRKADQEKMEKKEFAEKQQILARKYDFYRAKRRKTEDVRGNERKELENRTFNFCRSSSELPGDSEICPFGSLCLICLPVLQGELPYESDTIFNPSFQRVDDPDRYVGEQEANEDLKDDFEIRGGRKVVREAQRTTSALKLSELIHTFKFIERYNDGMIDASEKQPVGAQP